MGTPNDQAVLQAIFNPDTPFGDVVGLDLGEEAEDEDEDGAFPRAQLEQSKALELQGVMAAEAGHLSTALEKFSQAIRLLPGRASGYNNRAQARRLQGDVAGAREDLELAVTLSRGRGRAARQAFVQRGLLARLQDRDDDARRDFERAARLGSPFARRQLALLNPYAALCNRMLADMMAQLRGPHDGRCGASRGGPTSGRSVRTRGAWGGGRRPARARPSTGLAWRRPARAATAVLGRPEQSLGRSSRAAGGPGRGGTLGPPRPRQRRVFGPGAPAADTGTGADGERCEAGRGGARGREEGGRERRLARVSGLLFAAGVFVGVAACPLQSEPGSAPSRVADVFAESEPPPPLLRPRRPS
ncbi:tetratricopeptide repeat protein 36 [Ctenodactylus gundi]